MYAKVLIALLGSIQAVQIQINADDWNNQPAMKPSQGLAEYNLAQDWEDEDLDSLAETDDTFDPEEMQLAQSGAQGWYWSKRERRKRKLRQLAREAMAEGKQARRRSNDAFVKAKEARQEARAARQIAKKETRRAKRFAKVAAEKTRRAKIARRRAGWD